MKKKLKSYEECKKLSNTIVFSMKRYCGRIVTISGKYRGTANEFYYTIEEDKGTFSYISSFFENIPVLKLE